MQTSKEKVKNMASAAKEQVDIYKARLEEKVDAARARTEVEKAIAHDLAKAKEAKAKMEHHEAKAKHAEEKITATKSNYQTRHQPTGAVPTYPLGGNPPMNKRM